MPLTASWWSTRKATSPLRSRDDASVRYYLNQSAKKLLVTGATLMPTNQSGGRGATVLERVHPDKKGWVTSPGGLAACVAVVGRVVDAVSEHVGLVAASSLKMTPLGDGASTGQQGV